MTRADRKPPAQLWPPEVLDYTFKLRQENKRWRERVEILEARQIHADADVARLQALVTRLGGDPSEGSIARRRPVLVRKAVQP